MVSLIGCAVFDAPKFQPSQYETDIRLKVIPTYDFSYLEKKYGYESLGGMAKWNGNRCTIYVPMLEEVRDPYTMCVLGHEVFHCILGTFHRPDEGETCNYR